VFPVACLYERRSGRTRFRSPVISLQFHSFGCPCFPPVTSSSGGGGRRRLCFLGLVVEQLGERGAAITARIQIRDQLSASESNVY